jgi:cyclopropane-fatty-acyl-phospholipid synthase
LDYALQACRGLHVELQLQDYRNVTETFDRVVSVGMFEHVGHKNHAAFMQTLSRVLSDASDALALLHFFSSQTSFPNRTCSEVNWISRSIFPGMVIPSLAQVGKAIDGRFVVEDLHNFGQDYDPTLMAWHKNFEDAWGSSIHNPQSTIRNTYGPRFYRLWRYYLLSCAGAFRARRYQLWQMVLSKKGKPGGYVPVR